MELSVIETIWTALWARNCANIQQVLILKFAFGPEKFSGSFEKWAPDPTEWQTTWEVPFSERGWGVEIKLSKIYRARIKVI